MSDEPAPLPPGDDDLGIETGIERGVLTVTINRPQRGNALPAASAIALADLLDDASLGSGEVRAVLIRAEGRHFCTGADLSGRGESEDGPPINGHMVRSLARTHHRAAAAAFHCRVPVVAAVRGRAMGFGLHLALAADFVVAGSDATFNEPFTNRGFSVDSGGSWLLPRLIGLTRAKQAIYLGDDIDAETALDWGLVYEVTEPDALDARAHELARQLADRPTQALAASKRLLHDNALRTLDDAMHAESMAVELTLRSADFKAGMRAFATREPPEFTGR